MYQSQAVEGYVKEVIDGCKLQSEPSVFVESHEGNWFYVFVIMEHDVRDIHALSVKEQIIDRIGKSGYKASVFVVYKHQGQ